MVEILDIPRRDSVDHYEKMTVETLARCHSMLQKSCSKCFLKPPVLNKDFLGKVQIDVPGCDGKNSFPGYRINVRRVLLLSGLLLLFTTSLISTVLLWTTNLYYNSIHKLGVIAEDSLFYSIWQNPPAKPLIKFHLFNYTNFDRFENRLDAKLHVEEIGPYVYEEELEKVDIQFSENGETVSYREKRTYNFMPHLSNGTEFDKVTIPNMVLLSGAANIKHMNFFLRMSFSTFLKSISAKPFITLTTKSLIKGYKDDLYDFSKSVMKYRNQQVYETFGLLSMRNGVQPEVFTVNTGAKDFNKIGKIELLDGETSLNFWNSDECNNIQYSDSYQYPINQIENKEQVKFFIKLACRSLAMDFKSEDPILNGDITVYRYEAPESIYDLSPEHPENECYCDDISGMCPLKGLFNITKCMMGAPFFYSLPHFHGADPSVQNVVTGLEPNNRPYTSYVHIHPTMGFITGGRSFVQTNVQVQRSFGVSQVSMFEDGSVLPIVWTEMGLDEEDLPEELKTIIYRASCIMPAVESVLKYGSFLIAFTCFTCIYLLVKKLLKLKEKYDN